MVGMTSGDVCLTAAAHDVTGGIATKVAEAAAEADTRPLLSST